MTDRTNDPGPQPGPEPLSSAVEALADQIAQLRKEMEQLYGSLGGEVRTRRLVVVNEEDQECLVASADSAGTSLTLKADPAVPVKHGPTEVGLFAYAIASHERAGLSLNGGGDTFGELAIVDDELTRGIWHASLDLNRSDGKPGVTVDHLGVRLEEVGRG